MTKKGIILAGGNGTRLHPATRAMSKQLMPVHDKPMIYYPLCTLMQSGIRDILLISTPRDLPQFRQLLGDGIQWGLQISYAEQPTPRGLADAFIVGRSFIGNDNVAMVLGDNLYYGHGLHAVLHTAAQKPSGATVFAYRVSNPERYGVIVYNANNMPEDILEKPQNPPSRWAVTGLYFYDNHVVDIAKDLKPSQRNEIEITDINRIYLKQKQMDIVNLGRGYAWLDAGTHETLADATNFVRIIEQRQNIKIGCVEEIALAMKYINADQVLKIASETGMTPYADYLRDLVVSTPT